MFVNMVARLHLERRGEGARVRSRTKGPCPFLSCNHPHHYCICSFCHSFPPFYVFTSSPYALATETPENTRRHKRQECEGGDGLNPQPRNKIRDSQTPTCQRDLKLWCGREVPTAYKQTIPECMLIMGLHGKLMHLHLTYQTYHITKHITYQMCCKYVQLWRMCEGPQQPVKCVGPHIPAHCSCPVVYRKKAWKLPSCERHNEAHIVLAPTPVMCVAPYTHMDTPTHNTSNPEYVFVDGWISNIYSVTDYVIYIVLNILNTDSFAHNMISYIIRYT
jgi:hypothetical protein